LTKIAYVVLQQEAHIGLTLYGGTGRTRLAYVRKPAFDFR